MERDPSRPSVLSSEGTDTLHAPLTGKAAFATSRNLPSYPTSPAGPLKALHVSTLDCIAQVQACHKYKELAGLT